MILPDLQSLCAVFAIVTFGFVISSATGFGAAIISIPLLSLVIDVKLAIPLLALSSVINATVMVLRERNHIDWREFRMILLWGGMGFPAGNIIYHLVPLSRFKFLLGLFIVGVAMHALWRTYHKRPRTAWRASAGRLFLLAGGFVQGAFTTGGPLLVTYANHAIHDRRRFRVTMFMVWIVLNAAFMITYFSGPQRDLAVLPLALICLPALVIGMWLGQKIHHQAGDQAFQLLIQVTILLAGLMLIFR